MIYAAMQQFFAAQQNAIRESRMLLRCTMTGGARAWGQIGNFLQPTGAW
jgi:hypothetical protein